MSSQGPHDSEYGALRGPTYVGDAGQTRVEHLGRCVVVPPAHLQAAVVEGDTEGGREGGASG
eukprot:CAMPEP_0173328754 /NCGR_PEP_ID=MMETSP1144-20121109/2341_1 /TAXON_ID=483371 /ORGANISM="non described non described, Strain CCMP2298" /LENGTH=61 /DNA_ID=CAMNT_0014273299 /DNA_START=371 /DNA_END=556 /DNA_ORIENTATION=+